MALSRIEGGSIKDYYIRLQTMHKNIVTLLNGINQSLQTNTSEITVTLLDTDDTQTEVRIPSFLYLENKIEELSNNWGYLFNIPSSGDAWFTRSSADMYHLQMVRSNTALPIPSVNVKNSDNYSNTTAHAKFKENNILKDLVNPKTYIRVNIESLPSIAESVMMRKYVFFSSDLYDVVSSMTEITQSLLDDVLYTYVKGVDYEVYESVLSLPIKKDSIQSEFKINNVEYDTESKTYKCVFDTLEYYDSENSSQVYYLGVGSRLVLGSTSCEYLVQSINSSSNEVELKQAVGTYELTDYDSDGNVLQIVNESYDGYNYVDVPLEENPYIAVCLSVVYNGIRSSWSNPLLFDLNAIIMYGDDGNPIVDSDGNEMSYIEYYNKYCQNIGDLIAGISSSAYPQITNFTSTQLNLLQNGDDVKNDINYTISDVLRVVPINKHLVDDTTNESLISLQTQKSNLTSQIRSVQEEINTLYDKIKNGDFSQSTSDTLSSLQSQLSEKQTQKTSLQSQFNDVVDEINADSLKLNNYGIGTKYRVRGVTNVSNLTTYIKNESSDKVELIGMEINYKYKNVSKDTTTLTVINSDTFTEWNLQVPPERERFLSFNSSLSSFVTEYVDYSTTDNIIKWNQIDIPITSGESVILKVRYKYNIGQPFISLYTPWSDELTIDFPDEYSDNVNVQTIIDTNTTDTSSAAFSKTLINDGYAEHIANNLVVTDKVFYHTPDHIYSGYNTSENNLLSLKEKLDLMDTDINTYKELLDDNTKSKYKVSLVIDNIIYQLSPNDINKINVYRSASNVNKFQKVEMSLNITNTSDVNVRLYSPMYGNIKTPISQSNINSYYNKKASKYQRVPIVVNDQVSPQYLGQVICFRQDDFFTKTNYYFDKEVQRQSDVKTIQESSIEDVQKNMIFKNVAKDYMNVNNKQVLLPYRFRIDDINTLSAFSSITKAMVAFKQYFEPWHYKYETDNDIISQN